MNTADLLTVGLLVLIEGLLSADNALVLGVLVLGLPRPLQKKALRYGLFGAFAFRTVATVLAIQLVALVWVQLAGGLYLLNLTYQHFRNRSRDGTQQTVPPALPWLGLSAFWATVVKVELTDIVFAMDSILVAVAVTPKAWVVITGGMLGVVAMRLVTGQLVSVLRRYPRLIDAAFIVVGWVGLKLFELGNGLGWLDVRIPPWASLAVVFLILAGPLCRRESVCTRRVPDGASWGDPSLGPTVSSRSSGVCSGSGLLYTQSIDRIATRTGAHRFVRR